MSDAKSMMKDALILFMITLCSGLVLGLVYQITKEPIAEQEARAKQEAYEEVFREADSFESAEPFSEEEAAAVLESAGYTGVTINEQAQAIAGGETVGYVLTVTSHEGYGGDIQFSMGIKNDGTLNGISILSISETPGLGMKAEEVLKPQFTDKSAGQFEYTKTGAVSDDQIDAISGATITTKAVTNAVNAGLGYFQSQLQGGAGNE